MADVWDKVRQARRADETDDDLPEGTALDAQTGEHDITASLIRQLPAKFRKPLRIPSTPRDPR